MDLFEENDGRVESTDAISDISDLGATKLPVTPCHIDVETISNFSDISRLISTNTTIERSFVSNMGGANYRNLKQISDSLKPEDEINIRSNQFLDRYHGRTEIEVISHSKGLINLRDVIDNNDYESPATNKHTLNLNKCNFQMLWQTLVEILGEQDTDMIRSCMLLYSIYYNIYKI